MHVCRMVSSSSDIFASFCRVAPDKKKERKEPERKNQQRFFSRGMSKVPTD